MLFLGTPFFRTFLLYYEGISYNGKNRSSPTYLDSEINQKIRLGKTAFSHYTGHYLAKMHLLARPHERAFGCTEPVRIANQQNTAFCRKRVRAIVATSSLHGTDFTKKTIEKICRFELRVFREYFVVRTAPCATFSGAKTR